MKYKRKNSIGTNFTAIAFYNIILLLLTYILVHLPFSALLYDYAEAAVTDSGCKIAADGSCGGEDRQSCCAGLGGLLDGYGSMDGDLSDCRGSSEKCTCCVEEVTLSVDEQRGRHIVYAEWCDESAYCDVFINGIQIGRAVVSHFDITSAIIGLSGYAIEVYSSTGILKAVGVFGEAVDYDIKRMPGCYCNDSGGGDDESGNPDDYEKSPAGSIVPKSPTKIDYMNGELTWNASENASRYKVVINGVTLTVTEECRVKVKLLDGNDFIIRVTALSADGTESSPAIYFKKTPPKPIVPSNLSIVAMDGRTYVSFEKEEGANGFEVLVDGEVKRSFDGNSAEITELLEGKTNSEIEIRLRMN